MEIKQGDLTLNGDSAFKLIRVASYYIFSPVNISSQPDAWEIESLGIQTHETAESITLSETAMGHKGGTL